MEKLKRAVIREEYMAITGDMTEAIILNQFIYWSERVRDFDKFISEDKELLAKYRTEEIKIEISELKHGWIYKKASDLKDELMNIVSEKTINRKIDNLVEKGYLSRRNNPSLRYDRTYQYRVDLKKIMLDLLQLGYTIEGYKIPLDFLEMAISLNRQNDERISNDSSVTNRQNDVLKNQNDALNPHNVGAIPKTTTEIIKTEITNNKQKEVETIDNIKKDSNVVVNNNINKDFELLKVYLNIYLPKNNLTDEEMKILVNDFKKYEGNITKERVREICNIVKEQNGIDSLIKFFRSAIKNGYKQDTNNEEQFFTPKKNKRDTLRFNDYEQREYDYDVLEKKLLGWDDEN